MLVLKSHFPKEMSYECSKNCFVAKTLNNFIMLFCNFSVSDPVSFYSFKLIKTLSIT